MLFEILHFEFVEVFNLRRKKIDLTKTSQSLLAHQDWQISLVWDNKTALSMLV